MSASIYSIDRNIFSVIGSYLDGANAASLAATGRFLYHLVYSDLKIASKIVCHIRYVRSFPDPTPMISGSKTFTLLSSIMWFNHQFNWRAFSDDTHLLRGFGYVYQVGWSYHMTPVGDCICRLNAPFDSNTMELTWQLCNAYKTNFPGTFDWDFLWNATNQKLGLRYRGLLVLKFRAGFLPDPLININKYLPPPTEIPDIIFIGRGNKRRAVILDDDVQRVTSKEQILGLELDKIGQSQL